MKDLLSFPIIKKVAMSRWFRPITLFATLVFFEILILAGIVGSPVGNANAAIIVTWILWFFLLMAVFIPLGRSWCMICPITAPVEWISRKAVVSKTENVFNLGLKWPKRLDNIWLQNLSFLAVATASPLILTMPLATAGTLLMFVVLALIFDMAFQNRRSGKIFCRYICPLGGYVGLYSNLGVLGVRSRDKSICRQCTLKTCIKGNERGYGCPWFIYPGGMSENSHCGVCLECIKTCAYGNMTVQRVSNSRVERFDYAFKGFILLGSVIVYTAAYSGWWASLKELINFTDETTVTWNIQWEKLLIFAALISTVSLVILPAIHLMFAAASRKMIGNSSTIKEFFLGYSDSILPVGFMAWFAFATGMVMINGSYIVSVISDPFGWGWDIFGTARYSWKPYLAGIVPIFQLVFLLIGAWWAVKRSVSVTHEYSEKKTFKAMVPQAIYIGFLTFVLVYLFVMP